LHKTISARFPHISLDTVNRTLLTFADIGLVEIVEGFGSARRYDPNIEPHHHAHCIKCGTIADFYSPHFDKLKVPAEIRRQFTVIGKRVVFNGICAACRRTQATGHDN
jgi:Fur family peroxide stress response transcriptional regulator